MTYDDQAALATKPLTASLTGDASEQTRFGLLEAAVTLRAFWRTIALTAIAAGLLGYGIAWVLPPTFSAQTTILPPQQQQSAAASALSSLGAMAGLPTAAAMRNPADQYVSLLESVTVSDRIIDRFDLMKVYGRQYRADARRDLRSAVRVTAGKRDGLIAVVVDDRDPQRAAEMANAYVEELRRMSSTLAVTEAQQRRVFFERQLSETNDRLTAAQRALELSGFTAGAIRAEPRTAAEAYARLQAEVTAAEVRLQTMSSYLNDKAPEVRQAQETVAALRSQLRRLEQTNAKAAAGGEDYVGKYRDFKYQETLLALLARQYEMARLDESQEGALVQVVDAATVPEKRSKPVRTHFALGAAMAAGLLTAVFFICRQLWRMNTNGSQRAHRLSLIQASLGRDAPR